MSNAPASLTALAAYWESQGGKALGIVGNAAHRSGYHLGKDRIFSSTGLGWEDYSVQLTRDRRGLTNAASALDLGRLNGSLKELQAFSRWLVSHCLAHGPGYEDVREIIYSPDGNTVQRWSGVDSQIHTGPGNGDSSHTSHTHISYFRDSQRSAKVPLFEPYFLTPPDSSTGDDMPLNIESNQLRKIRVPKGTPIFDLSGKRINEAPSDLERIVYHQVRVEGDDIHHYFVGQFPGGGPGPDLLMVRVGPSDDLGSPDDATPYGPEDLDNAYNAGRAAVIAAGSAVPKR